MSEEILRRLASRVNATPGTYTANAQHAAVVQKADLEFILAEVERLRGDYETSHASRLQAEQALDRSEAEVKRLRAALEKLIDYARQLELVAYPPDDVEHPVLREARAALRGGE